MNTSTSAHYSSRFFKSDQRGPLSTEGYKCLSTFNFRDYSDENKTPFGALQFINDVAVAPENAVFFNRDESIQDIILPVTGDLTCRNFLGQKEVVNPEKVAFLDPGTGHGCEIQNNYEKDWINYLHIGIKKTELNVQKKPLVHPVNFTSPNTFASLNTDAIIDHSFGYAGVFTGRAKGNYEVKKSDNGIFVYVINGAFEVEERLMESRDGLGVWDKSTIEFEALSENAILLLFEVPLTIN